MDPTAPLVFCTLNHSYKTKVLCIHQGTHPEHTHKNNSSLLHLTQISADTCTTLLVLLGWGGGGVGVCVSFCQPSHQISTRAPPPLTRASESPKCNTNAYGLTDMSACCSEVRRYPGRRVPGQIALPLTRRRWLLACQSVPAAQARLARELQAIPKAQTFPQSALCLRHRQALPGFPPWLRPKQ